MSTSDDFTSALTTRLRHTKSPEQIDHYARVLADLHGLGLQIGDVVDDVAAGGAMPGLLIVEAQVPVARLGQAMGGLQDRADIGHMKIEPRGIPQQDVWNVRIAVREK